MHQPRGVLPEKLNAMCRHMVSRGLSGQSLACAEYSGPSYEMKCTFLGTQCLEAASCVSFMVAAHAFCCIMRRQGRHGGSVARCEPLRNYMPRNGSVAKEVYCGKGGVRTWGRDSE